jgi:hypothetical protein
MRHRWITDEDVDLSEGRVSKDIDQQELHSTTVQEWLLCVEESVAEDVMVEDAVVAVEEGTATCVPCPACKSHGLSPSKRLRQMSPNPRLPRFRR